MKLAVATGVLAQAFPTFSQKTSDIIPQDHHESLAKVVSWTDKGSDVSLVKAHDERRHHNREAMLANFRVTKTGPLTNHRIVDKHDTKHCVPASNNPDIGILSCGPGMFCKPSDDSLLGGRCEVNEGNNRDWSKVMGDTLMKTKGSFYHVKPPMECDPASTADIGILACGDGEHCVASSLSGVGGFCVQQDESRQLETRAFGMCDPSSSYYKSLNCDCSGYDVSSGSGEIPCMTMENYCLGVSFPGCQSTCETRIVRYQVANTALQAASACSNFTISDTSAQTFCFGQSYVTGTCSMSIDSQACASCTVIAEGPQSYLSFDCTNVGGIVGNTKQSRKDFVPTISACYIPPANDNCTLCTTAGTVMTRLQFDTFVTVGDFGNFSCNALHANEYVFGPIGENYCSASAAAASAACCDTICYLCSEGSYIPPNKLFSVVDFSLPGYKNVTCGDMLYSASVTFAITGGNCEVATSVAQTSCCSPYLYETCNVCEGPLVNSNAMVNASGYYLPCFALNTLRNDTVCEVLKPQAIPVCCNGGNGASSPPPSPISSPAPFPGPDESPTTEAPSGSSTQFPIRGILSALGFLAMGLVAVVMN